MALRKGLFGAVLARKSLANECIFVTERRPSGAEQYFDTNPLRWKQFGNL
jgi:hypothetical protein